MARRLVVYVPRAAQLQELQAHLARGGLFLPWVEPPPEPFALLEVGLHTPAGSVDGLLARVVHLAQGSGVALAFEELERARRPLEQLFAAMSPAYDQEGAVTARWEAPSEAGASAASARPSSQPPRPPSSQPSSQPSRPPERTEPEPTEPGLLEIDLGDLTLEDPMDSVLVAAASGQPELSLEEPEPPQAEPAVDEAESATLYDRIRTMTAAEKMQLALKGDRSARLLLLKDMNKVIHTFVVQNPKITLDEVRYVAGYRQANPDALKYISEQREWMINPGVVAALVCNPKTPAIIALKLLEKLPMGELRRLAKSDNVPRAVQLAARRKVTSE